MISTEFFQRLRSAQARAAREQQVLSGRDWLLVAVLVQLMASLSPLFGWINYALLGGGVRDGLHPAANFVAMVGLAAAVAILWLWARYAPFRAAMTATVLFVLVHGALGYVDPSLLSSGAVGKALVLVGLLQAARISFFRHRAL